MLKTPTIVLNVKTYSEATGNQALEIAMLMDKISEETGTSMAIAVQATDIYLCSKKVSIPVDWIPIPTWAFNSIVLFAWSEKLKYNYPDH